MWRSLVVRVGVRLRLLVVEGGRVVFGLGDEVVVLVEMRV